MPREIIVYYVPCVCIKGPKAVLHRIYFGFKKNGFEVLTEIKLNAKTKSIPVVMLTNLAGQAGAERALSLGAVLYLVKSQYDPKQIVDKVKDIISATTRSSDVPHVSVEVKDINSGK